MEIKAGQKFIKSYETEEGSEIAINYVVLSATAQTVVVQREGRQDAPMKRRVNIINGVPSIKLESYSYYRAYLA